MISEDFVRISVFDLGFAPLSRKKKKKKRKEKSLIPSRKVPVHFRLTFFKYLLLQKKKTALRNVAFTWKWSTHY